MASGEQLDQILYTVCMDSAQEQNGGLVWRSAWYVVSDAWKLLSMGGYDEPMSVADVVAERGKSGEHFRGLQQ